MRPVFILETNLSRERDWTKGSIAANLWRLSWPLVVSQSLNMLGPTIDMIWVGRLSSEAIAGVGVSGMAVMVANSIMMGLGMGASAIIARFVGAGDEDKAVHAAQQSFVVCLMFIIIMVPSGVLLAEPILNIMGVTADVIVEGKIYMQIMFMGSAVMSFRMITESIMQASGDTTSPMRIAVLFRILHVILAPMLIFGYWIFPELGVRGAAITNIISQGAGLILGMWILFTGRTRLKLSVRNFSVDWEIIWRIVKVGIPASVMGVQRGLGNMILMRFVVPFGTIAVAAHTLAQRVEMFVMMPAMGLGRGAGVLVGQNLGAGKSERAEKSGWLASGIAVGLLVTFSIIIFFQAERIIGIFGAEPEVVAITAAFIRIMAIGFLIFGLEPVLMQSLTGAGDTIPPMLATVLSFWVIQIPLAATLPGLTGIGVYGIRWGMVAGIMTAAIALAVYFKSGHWKQKRV